MSATFAKFHPNLVVGGTYSGQIVLWDNRSNKRTPVQRTPLSAAAHTVGNGRSVYLHHPIPFEDKQCCAKCTEKVRSSGKRNEGKT